MATICLPDLGEGIEKATVVSWLVKVGDRIKEDDDIVELVTDKASFNVPADCAGIVKKIFTPEGQDVKIGEPLALVEPTT
jgi:pyruvate/2-oxoglutarate dehydrogenase complex dihydrolipoamide acyltransferase (E2) component